MSAVPLLISEETAAHGLAPQNDSIRATGEATAARTPDRIDELYTRLSSKYIPALDGVRAIAITLVILYHFDTPPGVPGPLGVTIFFVLSGFLITWLLLKEKEKNGNVSLRKFYKRRFLRIFPAYYAYWLISLGVLICAGAAVGWREFASSFIYISNYYYTFAAPRRFVMPFTWSLAVEEQFYLIWPCLFCLFCNDLKKLTRALCIVIFGVWTYRLIAAFGFHASPIYLQHSLETRFDHLMSGALLAVILQRRALQGYFRFICSHSLLPFAALALLGGSVVLESFVTTFDYRHTIGYIVEPFAITTLLVQFVAFANSPFWKWLNVAPMRFVGRLSYSLYLYHFSAAKLMGHLLPNARWRWQLLAMFVASFLAACGSYYLIERPFLKLKKQSAR